jgi:hypothetical protein
MPEMPDFKIQPTRQLLKEAYRGADAYVTRNGLLVAQLSTFDMMERNEKRRR